MDASWVRFARPGHRGVLIVPGVGVNVTDGLNVYLDYDEWRREDPEAGQRLHQLQSFTVAGGRLLSRRHQASASSWHEAGALAAACPCPASAAAMIVGS